MPEDSKETKAKKLAAARKKLKEYQQRGSASGTNIGASYNYAESSNNSGHVSSNVSERSESELHLNGIVNDISVTEVIKEAEPMNAIQLETVNYFTKEQPIEIPENVKLEEQIKTAVYADDAFAEDKHKNNAIQVLITEKSQLTTELNKHRTLCREKDLELEELRVQHDNANKRVTELTQRLTDIQKQQDQQRLHNAELQHKLAQSRAQQEDDSSHLNELKQQLLLRDERVKQLDGEFKDKCNELELCQLRIRQLSDENSITKDNRVESLTQTQFMYEQQIRDLQAMVQQLTQDKEQANTQYQTYVQQLNGQVQQLNERNNELSDEVVKLQEREKQCVDHIQQLEKEIQKNISRNADIKQEMEKEFSKDALEEQLKPLQERLQEYESERYEFQLKIKSQEDRLNALQNEMKEKNYELEKVKDHLENVSDVMTDSTKLLATMESDKIAASRALTQNIELKKQLDELEMRFVQLTNDKADLMTRLDSEQYANREMHQNYKDMEERLRTIDERFKFKDEEMIRLSHENEELKKKLEKLNAKHEHVLGEHNEEEHFKHKHEHGDHDHVDAHFPNNIHSHEEHEHEEIFDYNTHNDCQNLKNHKHDEHDGKRELHFAYNQVNKQDSCEEVHEETPLELHTERPITYPASKTNTTTHIATEEAVEKLQQRFTQLMTQCADLTEEKQRLEHLVMQLQSETETIGEYITLYQTQRRILKQREYEKAAQTAMLQEEREQMRERLTMLNNLVNSLGVELPQKQELSQHLNEALAQNDALNVTTQYNETNEHFPSSQQNSNSQLEGFQTSSGLAKKFNSPESQQILHKIQDIITEIKENTKELPTMQPSVDQLNCCSGKFEVV